MKKLGSVESIEDFILAIAGGADVNGTWKGGPLIEHYFTEATGDDHGGSRCRATFQLRIRIL